MKPLCEIYRHGKRNAAAALRTQQPLGPFLVVQATGTAWGDDVCLGINN
jgi:hypothetical protein